MSENTNDKNKMGQGQQDKNNPGRTPEKQNEGQVREPQRQGGQQPNKSPDMGDPSKKDQQH